MKLTPAANATAWRPNPVFWGLRTPPFSANKDHPPGASTPRGSHHARQRLVQAQMEIRRSGTSSQVRASFLGRNPTIVAIAIQSPCSRRVSQALSPSAKSEEAFDDVTAATTSGL